MKFWFALQEGVSSLSEKFNQKIIRDSVLYSTSKTKQIIGSVLFQSWIKYFLMWFHLWDYMPDSWYRCSAKWTWVQVPVPICTRKKTWGDSLAKNKVSWSELALELTSRASCHMLEIKAPLCGPNTRSLRAPEVRQRAKKKLHWYQEYGS